MGREPGRPTVIGYDRGDRIVLLVGSPATGLAIGVADLREDLARLGFVVREDKERQFWRGIPGC